MPDPDAAEGSAPIGAGTALPRTGFDRALDAVDRVVCWVLIAMMAVMVVASVAQVVTRYLLETTLIGPEEIARYMMTSATFLSIPVAARRRNHIAVDALAHYLPRGVTQVVLSRSVLLFETAFLVLFSYYSFKLLQSVSASGQFSAGLEIPVSWPTSALLLGAGVGALMTGAMLVQTFLRPEVAAEGLVSSADEQAAQQAGELA